MNPNHILSIAYHSKIHTPPWTPKWNQEIGSSWAPRRYDTGWFWMVLLVPHDWTRWSNGVKKPRFGDIFSSFYFSTIALSTVGFGDIAPMTCGRQWPGGPWGRKRGAVGRGKSEDPGDFPKKGRTSCCFWFLEKGVVSARWHFGSGLRWVYSSVGQPYFWACWIASW
jgi:hypothetical protein